MWRLSIVFLFCDLVYLSSEITSALFRRVDEDHVITSAHLWKLSGVLDKITCGVLCVTDRNCRIFQFFSLRQTCRGFPDIVSLNNKTNLSDPKTNAYQIYTTSVREVARAQQYRVEGGQERTTRRAYISSDNTEKRVTTENISSDGSTNSVTRVNISSDNAENSVTRANTCSDVSASSWFKQPCTSSQSRLCQEPGARCYDRVWLCLIGLYYNQRDHTCVRNCSKYGPEMTVYRSYSINQHNDKTLFFTNLEECLKKCTEETQFLCLSCEFVESKYGRSCLLSKSGYMDVLRDDRKRGTAGWTMGQRNCL